MFCALLRLVRGTAKILARGARVSRARRAVCGRRKLARSTRFAGGVCRRCPSDESGPSSARRRCVCYACGSIVGVAVLARDASPTRRVVDGCITRIVPFSSDARGEVFGFARCFVDIVAKQDSRARDASCCVGRSTARSVPFPSYASGEVSCFARLLVFLVTVLGSRARFTRRAISVRVALCVAFSHPACFN